jgi:phosphatidylserine/phosphatidylglycerophosphate/cardiolipin synthase-like enzyme
MAKFLNTSATNYYLEELIKGASERLILISPFLKLNDRIKELLEDKDRMKIDVRIVYGKSELHPSEINWLKSLSFVRTSFCKNLHAKAYINEESCIITSMNLYEYSQINNNEFGIFISRTDDMEVYRDAFEEAQRIIRVSDEIRISLEKIDHNTTPDIAVGKSESKNESLPTEKLTTTKLAKAVNLKKAAVMQWLQNNSYVTEKNGGSILTEKAISEGCEHIKSGRFGPYILWASSIVLKIKSPGER